MTNWNDINFPVWVEHEFYDDTYELLRDFEHQTGFNSNMDDNDAPGLREFKYTTMLVWYKVTEGGSVTGPYANKGDQEMIQ